MYGAVRRDAHGNEATPAVEAVNTRRARAAPLAMSMLMLLGAAMVVGRTRPAAHDAATTSSEIDAVPPAAARAEAASSSSFSSASSSSSSSWSLEVFVDPRTGDDSNSGTAAAPLKTVSGARYAVRQLRATVGDALVTVVLSGGRHQLSETLELRPEDSNIKWIAASHHPGSGGAFATNTSSVLAGGARLSASCWQFVTTASDGGNVYTCDLSDGDWTTPPRVVRIDGTVALGARYPNRVEGAEYTDGFLIVEKSVYSNGSYWVTVEDEDSLVKKFMRASTFHSDVLYYGYQGWTSIYASMRAATTHEKTELDLEAESSGHWFKIECPINRCNYHDASIGKGTRFYVVNHYDALSDGEWYWSSSSSTLYVNTGVDGARPSNVAVPTLSYLFSLRGAEWKLGAAQSHVANVSFVGLRFQDTTFAYHGFQHGFNIEEGSAGIPADVVVRLDGAADVTVQDCEFTNTGGGGVLVTGGSRRVTVRDSTFRTLGQSGVMLVGNDTSQPKHVVVGHNTFQGVGRILASAGAVYASSASYVHVHDNTIEDTSRWAVMMRSTENATTNNNLIEYNTMTRIGDQTKDFGAVDFIGYDGMADANTVLRYNCIKHVIGVYSDTDGVETPYMNFGVYLDTGASGFVLHGNVIRDTVRASMFVHYGKNNNITNNIMVNANNADGSGGQVMWKGIEDNTRNNVFERNVIFYDRTSTNCLWYAKDSDPTWDESWATSDHNLVWCKNETAWSHYYNNSDLTPVGSWSKWQAYGNDQNSKVENPLFVDAQAGNWLFQADSPAWGLGIIDLPESVGGNC